MEKGVTLIETLIAIAIIGILGSIAGVNLIDYQRRLNVEQAIAQVSTDLNRARMDARRTNQAIEFVANAGNSTYEYGPVNNHRIVNLPEGISFTQGLNVNFTPPYGVLSVPNSSLEISGNNHTRKVSLIGILGKVVIREP
jgi:prepilin-type N-terminal cleavage/methylation domain-containing protein